MSYTYTYGSGTENDPYQVWTADDLDGVRDHLDKHFIQMDDIDLYGWNWVPIGHHGTGWSHTEFTGIYDGNNYEILNGNIDSPDMGYMGLFAHLGEGGKIKNLGVEINVAEGLDTTGGLVGWNSGTIQNCYNTGNVTGVEGSVGGLVGYDHGGVTKNCYTTGNVVGNGSRVGGLIGACAWSDSANSITNCYTSGNVTMLDGSGSRERLGGLIGLNEQVIVENCYATGTITGVSSAGGLIGENNYGAKLKKCYATGNVVASGSTAGGLVGFNDTSEIENCYAIGDVTGDLAVGGLVGYDDTSEIKNCYATGTITANDYDYAGGLVGFLGFDPDSTIINSYYDSETSGMSDTGKGEPRTTAQMVYPYTAKHDNGTYVDWEFEEIWHHDISHEINDGYPMFEPVEILFGVYSKITGMWKFGSAWIKKNGTWKSVTEGWIKEGGVWKPMIQ